MDTSTDVTFQGVEMPRIWVYSCVSFMKSRISYPLDLGKSLLLYCALISAERVPRSVVSCLRGMTADKTVVIAQAVAVVADRLPFKEAGAENGIVDPLAQFADE